MATQFDFSVRDNDVWMWLEVNEVVHGKASRE
jgi:hypothetical protein